MQSIFIVYVVIYIVILWFMHGALLVSCPDLVCTPQPPKRILIYYENHRNNCDELIALKKIPYGFPVRNLTVSVRMHRKKLFASYDFSQPVNIILLLSTAYICAWEYRNFLKIIDKQSSNRQQARRNYPQCCGENGTFRRTPTKSGNETSDITDQE